MIPRIDSSKSDLSDRCKRKESSIHSIHVHDCKLLVNKGMYFEQDITNGLYHTQEGIIHIMSGNLK